MSRPDKPHPASGAEVSIRIGKGVSLDAAIDSRGLLAVGALVSGILLSTAVIVFAAKRKTPGRLPERLTPPGAG